MADSIWATLSRIDCSEHIEKKGKFSYLAWTWAWAMVKENYPEANYRILKDKYFHGSDTMEVRVEVSIPQSLYAHDNGLIEPIMLTHTMWLPVLDFKNKPIINPDSFDINTARMRCLVKCLAMFGLGHYIYAGESLPQEKVLEESPEMIRAGAEINACLEQDDFMGAAQLWTEWEYDEIKVIARAPSKGGQLSTESRNKAKSTEFRIALNEAKGISMEGVA